MIEFDDAGSGCPILGEVFVARRVETGESVKVFLSKDDKRVHQDVLFSALTALSPEKDEEIHLCRGSIFNGFEVLLLEKGYTTTRKEIVGETNDLAEEFFYEKLLEIGLPSTVQIKDKEYAEFYKNILVWYFTFYKGKSLLKKELKIHYRSYLHYCIYDFPALVGTLFYDKELKQSV